MNSYEYSINLLILIKKISGSEYITQNSGSVDINTADKLLATFTPESILIGNNGFKISDYIVSTSSS